MKNHECLRLVYTVRVSENKHSQTCVANFAYRKFRSGFPKLHQYYRGLPLLTQAHQKISQVETNSLVSTKRSNPLGMGRRFRQRAPARSSIAGILTKKEGTAPQRTESLLSGGVALSLPTRMQMQIRRCRFRLPDRRCRSPMQRQTRCRFAGGDRDVAGEIGERSHGRR